LGWGGGFGGLAGADLALGFLGISCFFDFLGILKLCFTVST